VHCAPLALPVMTSLTPPKKMLCSVSATMVPMEHSALNVLTPGRTLSALCSIGPQTQQQHESSDVASLGCHDSWHFIPVGQTPNSLPNGSVQIFERYDSTINFRTSSSSSCFELKNRSEPNPNIKGKRSFVPGFEKV